MAVTEVPQLATDERVIDASNLEAALEDRQKRKASLGALRKQFEEADNLAKALLAEFALQDGEVARCGRFRIEKRAYPGRSVSFETNPSSRIRITPDENVATAK
jgi:hypothetical protein